MKEEEVEEKEVLAANVALLSAIRMRDYDAFLYVMPLPPHTYTHHRHTIHTHHTHTPYTQTHTYTQTQHI